MPHAHEEILLYISFHAHVPLSISATPLFVPSFLPFTLASSNIPSDIPQIRLLHAPRLKHEDVGVLVAEQVQQGDSIPAPIPNDQAA